MTQQHINYFISQSRFSIYLQKTADNFDQALLLYKANIRLSEAFYPVLSILEISLRNAVNERLTDHFDDPLWFKNRLPAEFSPLISKTAQRIFRRGKTASRDAIIAELNFGFWDRLFNRNYTALLWKPLRVIFKNAPKHLRKRDTIADSLYRIRTLRNRIYHYEPIVNNLSKIEFTYLEMITFLSWMEVKLPDMVAEFNRFTSMSQEVKVCFFSQDQPFEPTTN